MPNNPLQVRLEVTDQYSGRCTLSFNSSQYSIRLKPEENFTIRDWLRRLPSVLAGENDPAGQGMASALFEVRQALIQADRPDWAVPILQGSKDWEPYKPYGNRCSIGPCYATMSTSKPIICIV